MTLRQLKLSIIIPCRNEARTISGCVEEASQALAKIGADGEVLVIDNESTDESAALASSVGARVVTAFPAGYGSALRAGILAARGEYVLMADADGSYDFGELPKFITALEQGADLVIGCRLPAGGGRIEKGAMPWLHRWIGNPLLSWLGRMLYGLPIEDFHCGMRGFKREKLLALNLRCEGMEFASEMVVKAGMAGYNITQVPISLRRDRRGGRGHLRTWRDGWRHARFLMLYAPRWLFLGPGAVMLVGGLVMFAFLLRSPVAIGEVVFDLNTLLVSVLMILLGFQVVLFTLFAEHFGQVVGVGRALKRKSIACSDKVLEWAIAASAILFIIGFLRLVSAIRLWEGANFGDLPIPASQRMVIPAILAMALAIQILFNACMLALFNDFWPPASGRDKNQSDK